MKLKNLLKKQQNHIKKFFPTTLFRNTKTPRHGNKVFVHIPRTGGTTILSEIKKHNLDVYRNCHLNHDPLFELQQINYCDQDPFVFCFVRNPFTRTYSYYNHYIKYNKYCSFSEFLNRIKLKIHSNTTPYYLYPQSFYVYNLDGEICLTKIFKFENYKQNLLKIKEIYNKNFNFKHENASYWTKENFLKDYTDNNKNLVRNLFSVDFINFNYDEEGKDTFI